ncbi:MarR family winged helix-turn-helix transcriptional regulator [Vibrio renipiscarius]|uniref:Transcriptional regulator n=1 Tax=Vibrio renipiscarius TaxID=1461322 RepID=A0A0C2NK79_9VIBR|nr:MarR family transcriptional regulator [Vibrio renipiscarius]KII76785.1 transcriptional regulator [Vibrio renipiscarius]KII78333.1 transcriptional regulator [Vibrio renipiscarius]
MDPVERAVNQWATEKPQLDTEPMAIIGRMLLLSKHLETQISKLHKQHDLKLGEFDVLASLLRSGKPHALTPSELLDALMLTSGAMTNRLDRLEGKGLITRVSNKHDRRSVTVQLTESGFELMTQLIEQHVNLQEELIAGIAQQERGQLNAMLTQWLAAF